MKCFIDELSRKALEFASRYQKPDFYIRFEAEVARSRHLYFTNPVATLVRESIAEKLSQCECLGHGLYHSSRVAWDCAALLDIELKQSGSMVADRERILLLGIVAGLLHDIARCEPNHAEAGAREAARILRDFPFTEEEISIICRAIRNHEAFSRPVPSINPVGQLLSDCLYDADKFRWGVDNFTHTIWRMIDHQSLSPQALIERFPWGIDGIRKIAQTFRTPTGRQFGPDIIENGIAIGKDIYQYLLKRYGSTITPP
ncbi:MAG: HD domain-containing protein [Thermodesulforhabdaceae bacterium]